jgi:hypothetical protein
MSRLNPEKLSVEFRTGVTKTAPTIPRKYTLTHSDTTAELFLAIGLKFAFDQVTAMRDEVLGEWLQVEGGYQYYVYLHVGGDFGQDVEEIREFVFRKELPLALEAIRYGDRIFFEVNNMDQYPIIVYFLYENPAKNVVENWGTFAMYKKS